MGFGLEVEGLPLGTLVASRYRLEKHLGSGGFGAVFAATDTLSGRRVALKVLERRTLDLLGGEARFRREAELARRLQHPHIVAVLDEGNADGTCYIAFELLDGRSLRDELAQWGALSQRRAAEITLQVLSGLIAAHSIGIVHRDLKPANIYLLHGSERVKILDFGIAKSTNPDTMVGLTQDGQMLGTPAYMAPEQLTNKNISPASDLFALGVVLLEMLLGHNPYPRDLSAMMVVRQRLVGEPLPMPEALRDKPLGQIILRASQHLPEQRYPSAEAMRDAIEAVIRAPDFVDAVLITGSRDDAGSDHTTADPYGHTSYSPQPAHPPAPWPQAMSHPPPGASAPPPWPPPPAPHATSDGIRNLVLVAGAIVLLALVLGTAGGLYLALRPPADARRNPSEPPEDETREEVLEEAEPPEDDVGRAQPVRASLRVVRCPGAGAQSPQTLHAHLGALGVHVTGELLYCAGNMVNFVCDDGDGRGVTVSGPNGSGNVAVVRFRDAARADAFVSRQNGVSKDTTLGTDGSVVLLAELPPPSADRLLQRICR